jgi:hypothetical protein
MNYLAHFFKITAVDLVYGLLRFPVWWYAGGLVMVIVKAWHNLAEANAQLAWTLRGRYLFTPMYGDYSRTGRLISFFIRVLQYILITALLLLVVVLNLIMVIVWIAALPATIWFIFRNII